MHGKSYNIYQLIHKKKLDKIVLEVGFGRGTHGLQYPVGDRVNCMLNHRKPFQCLINAGRPNGRLNEWLYSLTGPAIRLPSNTHPWKGIVTQTNMEDDQNG